MILCSVADEPIWLDDYKILTRTQLNINSLQMMGYADFRKSHPPLAYHYHPNMEFMVMIKGRQQYALENRLFTLKGGDIFVTFPDEIHGTLDYPTGICEFIWFHVDLSSSENFLDLKPQFGDYLFEQLSNYNQRLSRTTQENLHTLYRAFHLLHSDVLHDKIKGYNLFLEFLLIMLGTDEKIIDNHNCAHAISNAKEFIQAHLTENPSLETVASHCGISPSKLYSQFKEREGISPHAYANMLKIDMAKMMLEDSANSITDIAFSLNFSSSNHFASVFKKHTGETPTSFRQQQSSRRR